MNDITHRRSPTLIKSTTRALASDKGPRSDRTLSARRPLAGLYGDDRGDDRRGAADEDRLRRVDVAEIDAGERDEREREHHREDHRSQPRPRRSVVAVGSAHVR